MTQSIRVLVLGDSGVGKTTLVNYLANPTSSPADYKLSATTPTVGVNTAVRAIPRGRSSFGFIEFIDITGSRADSPSARAPFMNGAHAAIFVHDGGHPPSARNILAWAEELATNVLHSGRSSDDGSMSTSARSRRDARHPAGFAHRRPQQAGLDHVSSSALDSSLFAGESGSLGMSTEMYRYDDSASGPQSPLVNRGVDGSSELPVPTIIVATRAVRNDSPSFSLANSVFGGLSTLHDRFQKFTLSLAHVLARGLFLPDTRPVVKAYAAHAREVRDAPVHQVVRHLRHLFGCDSVTVDVTDLVGSEDGLATMERFLADVVESVMGGGV